MVVWLTFYLCWYRVWKREDGIWSNPLLPCQIPDVASRGHDVEWHLPHASAATCVNPMVALQPAQACVTVTGLRSSFQRPCNESAGYKTPAVLGERRCMWSTLYVCSFSWIKGMCGPIVCFDLNRKKKNSTSMWFIFPALAVLKLVCCPELFAL